MNVEWIRRLWLWLTSTTLPSPSGPRALLAPEVVEANGDKLDPRDVPATGATVRLPVWIGMAYRDRVELTVSEYTDYTVVNQGMVDRGEPPVFYDVPKALFVAAAGATLDVACQVNFYAGGQDTAVLTLIVSGGFDQAAQLDLTGSGYLSIAGHPPPTVPEQARMRRAADWGRAPYAYASSDADIAQVDANGEVTALANGTCRITATDSSAQTQSYSLTISGMRVVHFVSASCDWAGMQAACTQAGLAQVTRDDFKALWQGYYPQTGPVASFAGWLNYSFWAADSLGAGTAWAYDLNGTDVNGNASSHDTSTMLQAVGLAS
ncbi:Ig-like domain-containing protein [Pseudomonas sichuanensis]|uniref:Ig-like domain-containing protein n=1 Tax=Pseudomonas sichuanensis TaxID=2213015 RepID=UPI00215FC5AB|nr:Ig-like domain-containing protein [Pseudomonas sichuanensis]UVK84406.1 Ig-like domain-containing protein [Pseudomonas sichuanensis]